MTAGPLLLTTEAIETGEATAMGCPTLEHLRKRANIIKGVCITGGEPTLQKDLPAFIDSIKSVGLKVKLDTNGFNPDCLSELIHSGSLDYIAMDIKGARDHYAEICGVKSIDIARIEESVELIATRAPQYEFRTTYVKGLHTMEDVKDIGRWLAGEHTYYIQNYKEGPTVISPIYDSFSDEEKRLQPHRCYHDASCRG